MRITLSSNIAEVRAQLTQFSDRRFNAAMATALTRTAVKIKAEVLAHLPRVFDRPTAYTMNSLFVSGATANKLQAETYFKDDRATTKAGTPAVNYLLPHVDGGARRSKRLEVALRAVGALPDGFFVVPGGGAILDDFGNVSRGQIVQVLSQLRIQLVGGSSRNMSFDARKAIAAQRKAGGRYFLIRPGQGRQAPGVYQREFIGRNVTPVFLFVNKVSYKRRFDFAGITQRVAQDQLPIEVQRAVDESMARLQARS
jgi:hypothetical protein